MVAAGAAGKGINMINIPEVKIGLVAVSRDCFPASLAGNRRSGRSEDSGYYSDRRIGNSAGMQSKPPAARDSSPLRDPVKLRVSKEVLAKHRDVRTLLFHMTDAMSLYPGDRDVLIYLPGQKPVRCSGNRIAFTDEARARFIGILGEENVKG